MYVYVYVCKTIYTYSWCVALLKLVCQMKLGAGGGIRTRNPHKLGLCLISVAHWNLKIRNSHNNIGT